MDNTQAIYYKATRPDGTDFYTGTVLYAVGGTVAVPVADAKLPPACCTSAVLHAADTPSETLIGGTWPCRLFEVTGEPVAQEGRKFGFRQLTVTREISAWQSLGPNGEAVAALIDRAGTITDEQAEALHAAWSAVWDAARGAAWSAAWGAARGAAWDAAWDAALALVVRDLINPDHYQTLTGPWVSVMGPAHPDDKERA